MYHKLVPVLENLLSWESGLGGWESKCWREAKATLKEAQTFKATPREIEVARNLYQTDEIEIDDEGVMTSPCKEDRGRWVSAWVWVSDEDMKADE